MTRRLQVKGVPLIKFQKEWIIDSLQNGKIYAKTLDYYRQLEIDTGDDHVGDHYEAMLPVVNGIFQDASTGEISVMENVLVPTKNSNDYVFCMFSFHNVSDTFAFTDQQKAELLKLGDTALLITDVEEFKRRIWVAAEEQGYQVHFEPVRYYDEQENCADMILDSMRGLWTLAFWKRKRYAYQQEARFVFLPYVSGQDHLELDIGDIHDITCKMTAEEALSAICKAETE